MTERQKEILKKRALLEFLEENPDISIEQIDMDNTALIKQITYPRRKAVIKITHWCLAVILKNNPMSPIIFIPKERFKVEEE